MNEICPERLHFSANHAIAGQTTAYVTKVWSRLQALSCASAISCGKLKLWTTVSQPALADTQPAAPEFTPITPRQSRAGYARQLPSSPPRAGHRRAGAAAPLLPPQPPASAAGAAAARPEPGGADGARPPQQVVGGARSRPAAALTAGVLSADEVLVGLQQAPELGVVVDRLLQRLQGEAGRLGALLLLLGRGGGGGRGAAGRRERGGGTGQHPRVDVAEEALGAGGEVDGGVLVDAQGHAAVHHPAVELAHGEGQSAPGRLAAAEAVAAATAHVVEGEGAEGSCRAAGRQRPAQDNLHGAPHLVLGALGEAEAQSLCLPSDAHQRPAHQRREPRRRIPAPGAGGARRPRLPARRRRQQQCLHLLQAPGDLLKVGQEPGALLPRAVQHLGVFR